MDVSFEFLQERYELSIEKIRQIAAEELFEENDVTNALKMYFKIVAAFICLADEYVIFRQKDFSRDDCEENFREWNEKLYRDILPENYNRSFANPSYAKQMLGDDYGSLLSALYAEVLSLIGLAGMADILEERLIRLSGDLSSSPF